MKTLQVVYENLSERYHFLRLYKNVVMQDFNGDCTGVGYELQS